MNDIDQIWLRSESPSQAPRGARPDLAVDRRTPLTPKSAAYLIANGISVTVERSAERAYADDDYERCGCRMVSAGSYESAPKSALILGLRPPQPMPITIQHSHALFSHAFKGQPNWYQILLPFIRGRSTLYDLEYLTDANKERLASFGQMAGAVALATGLFAWSRQVLGSRFPGIQLPDQMISQMTINSVESLLRMAQEWTQKKPRCVVIGGDGRCGRGVIDFAKSINIEIVSWTRAHTGRGGPFPELLDFDIVVNAIRIKPDDESLSKPWLTNELIRTAPRCLSVIVDISCEPNSAYNPFPLYKQATTFENPTLTLIEAHDGHSALDLIAIPNFPSLLPVESSDEFSAQLTPLLHDFIKKPNCDVWIRAAESFHSVICPLEIPPTEITVRVPAAETDEISFDIVPRTDRFDITTVRCFVHQQVKQMLYSILSALEFGSGESSLEEYEPIIETDDIHDVNDVYRYLQSKPIPAQPCYILLTRTHLAVAGHSAILDQKSVTLLTKALASCQVPQSNSTYRDYAGWFMDRLAEFKADKDNAALVLFRDDERYWKDSVQLLSAADHIVNAQLPTDFSISTKTQKASLRKRHSISISSSSQSYPLPVQVLAALSLITFRWTMLSDFVIGTRISFRNRASLLNTVGPFEDRCLLRFFFEKDLSVKEHLKQCLAQWNGVFRHQELPLRHISENYTNHNMEFICESEFTERFNLTQPFGDSQICIRLWPSNDLSIDYDPDAFLAETITEFADQIGLVLSELNETSFESSVLNMNLITSHARSLLPDPTVELDASYPGPITKVFKDNCLKMPDAIAISSDSGETTYGRLYHFVSWLSKQLRSAGIGRGDIVAIYGDRVPSVVWAIMAVLSSGAAFSMMDPQYPTERLIACLTIARPRAWIAMESAGSISDDLAAFLDQKLNLVARFTLPPLDDSISIQSLQSDSRVEICDDDYDDDPEIAQDDIAVVTFTSGSTGLPKGVCGRHGPLTHFYPWMGETFHFSSKDHFSMCSGIAHDPLQRDIFTPLFFGARICIPSARTIGEGQLSQWMERVGITVSCLTPAMGQLLTSSFMGGDIPTLDSLRAVFFVGDCLLKSDVIRLRTMAPNVTCVNMYGSTETQRAVGHLIVPDHLDSLKDVVPVGIGMRDVQLLVVNEAGDIAAIGERGEIYVRSPHLSQGYLNLPEQTAEKFVPNRFRNNAQSHDRMYRTGDLGRVNSCGWVECSGRADDQVKIRGFRIELGEINARLSQHRYVKECVTIVLQGNDDKRLASFVVLNSNFVGEGDVDEIVAILRSSLQSSLPHYMVPAEIHIISAMPLTPNGKINRNALHAPKRETRHERPIMLTATQEKVLQVWVRNLPNVAEINIDANFFDLGGHSLLATRLIMELSRLFRLSIPLQTLFTNSTVRSLSQAIDSLDGNSKCNGSVQLPNLTEDVNFNWCSDIEVSSLESDKQVPDILLTGCTGFVGCFLLAELLQRIPSAQIYCTVRAESLEAARSRIWKALQSHMLWRPEYQQRIVPVISDLSKPNLGWTDELFNEISSNVDMIIHNAAHVHWLLPYDRLRPVNVVATQFLLKVAANIKKKAFHYISTTSVLETSQNKILSQRQAIAETVLDADFNGLQSGYAQSKWVAERLVTQASAQGITASVYRLGFVTGDSRTGVSNTDDFLVRLMQGCIELGSCPFMEFDKDDRTFKIDMSPVDYVAEAIVDIILNKESVGRVFHVTSPHPLPFLSFFQQIKDYGYDLVNLPYLTWRQKLLDSIAKKEPNSLTPIVSYLTEDWTHDLSQRLQLDRSNVSKLSTTTFPSLDKIVQVYLSYLVRCGSIPAPKNDADDHLRIDWSAITDHVHRITRTQRN